MIVKEGSRVSGDRCPPFALNVAAIFHLNGVREIKQIVAQVAGVVRIWALPDIARLGLAEHRTRSAIAVIIDRGAGDLAVVGGIGVSEKHIVEGKTRIVGIGIFRYLTRCQES